MSLKAPRHREFAPALCLGIAGALQEEIRIATEVVGGRERGCVDALLDCVAAAGRESGDSMCESADDYDAELAERYGWINRALPAAAIGEFVRSLAHRIAGFPAAGRAVLKDRVNAISLAQADEFRRDSDLFLECARDPESQRRMRVAMTRGFQTHDGELTLSKMVGDLIDR